MMPIGPHDRRGEANARTGSLHTGALVAFASPLRRPLVPAAWRIGALVGADLGVGPVQGTHIGVPVRRGPGQGAHIGVLLRRGPVQGTHIGVPLRRGPVQGTHT